MKRSIITKIPTGVLLFCMLITVALSVWFFSVYINQSSGGESPEISALLSWIFFLLIITLCAGLIFSLFNYIHIWKENPKKALRFVAVISVCGLLLLINWLLGSGNPLPIVGYKGSENTYLWLKLTDMLLYTIYVLLSVGIIALLAGIVWSYFKKPN